MSILTVENLNHGFGARKILENVNFRLLKGEHVGLVGANGEGKSTFLNIITGDLMPDEGKITWCNRITTGYLDQHTVLQKGRTIREFLHEAFDYMYALEKEMLLIYENMSDVSAEQMEEMLQDVGDIQDVLEHNGFYILDSKIEEYANGLGLGEIGLEKDVSELSGGQRSKVLLTKLLLSNPMILILDEPTNFLDENHITWLVNFLKNYDNAFILVSHDTSFLSETVNLIYHIENGEFARYSGDYNYFLQMHELKKRQIEQAYERQQKEINNLEDFIARNKARAATANLAKSRQKRLDKMEIIELSKEKIKPTFNFSTARTPGKEIIVAKDLVIGYDRPLTKPLNFSIERNEKIVIKGVNGIGKSTLLKTMLNIIPPISGGVTHDQFLEIGYFEQEEKECVKTAFEYIWDEYPNLTIREVRGYLAKCGLRSEHIESQMKVLSGGENAKARLCKLMLRENNILILDEPTNHLDVDAKDSLIKGIKEFKGTVILVCHEPEFYENVITNIWDATEFCE